MSACCSFSVRVVMSSDIRSGLDIGLWSYGHELNLLISEPPRIAPFRRPRACILLYPNSKIVLLAQCPLHRDRIRVHPPYRATTPRDRRHARKRGLREFSSSISAEIRSHEVPLPVPSLSFSRNVASFSLCLSV